MKKSTGSKGFTLIELLVVIAIIGVLASVILASLDSARTKANNAARVSDVASFKTALELYYDDNNGYPTSNTTSNGDVPINDPIIVSKLVPKYLPSIPTILITDNDRYYSDAITTGVSSGYDMLIYNATSSGSECKTQASSANAADWAINTICGF